MRGVKKEMKNTKSNQRTAIYVLLALLVFAGVLMFAKRAFAEGEKITWDGITNDTVIVYTADGDSYPISGTATDDVLDITMYYVNPQYGGQPIVTWDFSGKPNKLFNFTVDLDALNLSTDTKIVYFNVHYLDNFNYSQYIPCTLGFTRADSSIVMANNVEKFFYDGTSFSVSGNINYNDGAEVVVCSEDTSKNKGDSFDTDATNNINGTDDSFTVTVPGNISFPDDGRQDVALYAVDKDNNVIVAKKTIKLRKIPELHIDNSEEEIDLSSSSSKDITFGVTGYKTGVKVGYTTNAYDLSTVSSDTVIGSLNGTRGINDNQYNSTVTISLDELTTTGTTVYIYLYKGSDIFDVESITVKRAALDIDSSSFKLVDSYGRDTNVIYMKVDENSVSATFKMDNMNYYSNSWSPLNPYSVVIVDITNNGYNVIKQTNTSWTRESVQNKYNYSKTETINRSGSLPRVYEAYLKCNDVKIDKSITFTVKDEIPELNWQDNRITDTIPLPIYEDTIDAVVSGKKDGDVVAWTTQTIAEADLVTWAEDEGTKKYTVADDNSVSFNVSELPLTDSDCFFYIIRSDGTDTEVISLGNYPIRYKAITHNFGLLYYSLPYDNRIYNISNTNYYFVGALQDSQAHKIFGYYEGGLASDELAWTDSEIDDAGLQEWDANEAINVIGKNYSDNRYQTEHIQRYYTYEINVDEISLVGETPKTIQIFLRRNIGGGNYSFTKLGEVILQKAHAPELTSVTSKTNYYFDNTENSIKDIFISLIANDIDTGVKEIEISYRKDNQTLTEKLYYVDDNNKYAPNQSVKIDKTLTGIKNTDDKYINITVRNFSGRETVYTGLFANKPDLTVKPVRELENFGQKDYYTSDTRNESFEIVAKKNEMTSSDDDESEMATLIVEVNGTEILNRDYTDKNLSEVKETINISNSLIKDAADGKYNIHIKATNKQKNIAENNLVLEVDDNKPKITGFVVNGKEMSSEGDTGKYTYITSQKIEAEIKASDTGSGGLKDIKYYWEETSGNKSQETTQAFEDHPENASTKATKDSSFKGFLYASAEDTVGNKPEKYATFGGVIIETGDKHNADNHIDIGVPDSGSKDRKGNPLYSGATTFSIKVYDNFSGIKSVEWRVSAPNDKSINGSGSLNINEGNLSDGTWSKNGAEKNIVTAVSKNISVDGNSDDCVLYVRMVDNAGNASEKSISFSIDKVKPTISVTYGNQTGDPDFKDYFADNRTATIVVKERNFNQDSANAIISNSTGNKGTLSGWTEKRDDANPDNSTYTATVTFDKDDRYNLTFQCSDRAGNAADAVTTQEFVIDKTVPVVTVTFDNANGVNGYYANARTATISVKDVNFDAGRVSITGVNGQSYTLSNWTRKDNTFSALMTFSTDGVFTFDVSAKDKAGNQSNSVHENKFTIDLEKPEIIIEGVADKSANNGIVAPKITFKDTNIDKNSLSVELSGANNGRVDLTDKYLVSEDGLQYTFKNIESKKENDDLYTLRASAKDLAGNVTIEEIKFSVNRFGSIYILGDNLKKINDKYVQSVKGIDITEINVNKIKKDSVVITLTVNGVPNTLVEGTDYKIDAEESEGDWKQYKYRFEDSLFVKDGSYILAVVSEDEAGNKNNNGNETKEAEVKFGVDATAPIVAPVNFEANKYYDSNGMDLSVSVKDNMILDSVTVYIDGQPVSCTQDGEIYTFHIDESNRRQEVKVVAKDVAGNETIESYEGLLIAGNFIVRFLHNKLAIIITSATGGSLVVGGGIFLSLRLFRKRI